MSVSLCGLSDSVCGEQYRRFPPHPRAPIPSHPSLSTPSHYAFFLAKINDKHASQPRLPSLSLSCFPSLFSTSVQQSVQSGQSSQTPLPLSSSWLPLSSGGQKPSLKNKILHLWLHKLSCADTHGNSTREHECVRLGVSLLPLWWRLEEELAGWSSVGGGGLEKRGRRNCCFYKESNKQAASGILSLKNPWRQSFSSPLCLASRTKYRLYKER